MTADDDDAAGAVYFRDISHTPSPSPTCLTVCSNNYRVANYLTHGKKGTDLLDLMIPVLCARFKWV